MNYILKIKPLSINQAFKGRRFRTDLYNDYIKDMKDILAKEIDIPDPKNVKIAIEFGFSTKLSDIDNCIKPFLDCLVKKYKVDDRYIYEMHVFKSIVIKGEEYIKFKIY
jgi:Holliday junction resolvase RusA-like endonuclease